MRNGVLAESYAYEVNGNRVSAISETGTYDVDDRITSYAGKTYGFDADGYLSTRDADGFVYSTRGELLSATVNATTVQYNYDGHARRVSRDDGSGTAEHLYGSPHNPFLVTDIRDPAGVPTSYYHDDAGLVYAMERGGSRFYIGSDPVGTPRIVVDGTGTTIETLERDSFGRLLAESNATFDLHVGFAGGLEDPETALVRFGYRDYDPMPGRWMARDPVLYEGDQANLYVYVGNEPIGLRDPLGLWCVRASGYAGAGGGMQLCCKNGKCSYCIEVGGGVGGSVGVGGGGPKRDKHTGVNAELDIKCASVGAGGGCSYNNCGELDCKGKLEAGGYEYDSEGDAKANAVTEIDPKCGLQGKLAVEPCIGW